MSTALKYEPIVHFNPDLYSLKCSWGESCSVLPNFYSFITGKIPIVYSFRIFFRNLYQRCKFSQSKPCVWFGHHYIPHSKLNDDSRCFKIFFSQGRHTLEKSVGGLKKTEIFRRPFQGERTPKRWKALFFLCLQREEREKGGGRRGEEGRESGDKRRRKSIIRERGQ